MQIPTSFCWLTAIQLDSVQENPLLTSGVTSLKWYKSRLLKRHVCSWSVSRRDCIRVCHSVNIYIDKQASVCCHDRSRPNLLRQCVPASAGLPDVLVPDFALSRKQTRSMHLLLKLWCWTNKWNTLTERLSVLSSMYRSRSYVRAMHAKFLNDIILMYLFNYRFHFARCDWNVFATRLSVSGIDTIGT